MEKKEAYVAPELTVYGPVKEVTEAIGGVTFDFTPTGGFAGLPDGGSPIRIIELNPA